MNGDVVALGTGQSLRIVSSSAEVLELESTWTASGSMPPRHYHPRQDEHFEVIEGRLTVEVDGERRVLRVGDALGVPRGAVHRMWNAGPGVARASWRVRPRLRTEEMFRFMDQGMSPLRIARLLWTYRNEYRPGLWPRR